MTAPAPTLAHAPPRRGENPIPCHILEPDGGAKSLLLLLHGRDGAGRSPHIVPIAEAYLARGWRVVAPDLPHSRAVPGSGPAELYTMSGHLEDAAAVLQWARDTWPKDARRLGLAGHSVGAWAAARLAAAEDALDHLLGVSPVLSGRALLEARRAMGPPAVQALRREAPAMLAELSTIKAAPALRRVTAPVAVVTGASDGITPPAVARAWFRAAAGACFYMALPGQHHCPAGPAYERALAAALDAAGA